MYTKSFLMIILRRQLNVATPGTSTARTIVRPLYRRLRHLTAGIIVICAALTYASPRQAFVDSLLNNFMIESCVDNKTVPLRQCAAQRPGGPIAPRLIKFLTWMDSTGRITNDRMTEALADRYKTFTAPTHAKAPVKTQGWPADGDPKSPVTITMYFSATCPMCKTTYVGLYEAVTNGPLKGKAKLVSKPFTATPQNKALIAAHSMNKFSEFMHSIAQRRGRVDETLIYAIADSLKMDTKLLKKLINDDTGITKFIEESTQEGRINEVSLVPTIFMNGRRYNNYLDVRWIIDAAEYVFETR